MQNKLKTARPMAKLVQGRKDWYSIKNVADGNAEIWVYDEIGYWGVTAQDFIGELQDLSASTIDLHLNTPGGDVFDGIAILNALRSHDASVTVYVDSLAASIGSVIAQAGDKRVMMRNSQMMIHKASTIAIGNDDDMEQMRDLLAKQNLNIANIYADRAGGEAADWIAAMAAETWYSAEEAVEAGLADEVGATGNDKAENSWDLSIYNYGSRAAAPAPVIAAKADVEFDSSSFSTMMREALA